MSDNEQENESIESILAEMRSRIAVKMGDAWYTQQEWRNLCDRLEAAWKREARAIATEHAVLPAVCITRPSGNAAAMREALITCRNIAAWIRSGNASVEAGVERIQTEIDKALSAPARNCDHFSSVEQARTVYCSECGRIISIWDGVESGLFEAWLFAPAAERKGEGDGR